MDNLIELIESLMRVGHWHVEEDCWYSCSADPECCDDERVKKNGGKCDCGADEHNRRVDEALAERNKPAIEKPKPIAVKPTEVITVDETKALAYYASLRQQEQALIAAQIEAELRTIAFLEAERLRKIQDDEDVFLLLAACGYTVKH
jgi:hypothetical protein